MAPLYKYTPGGLALLESNSSAGMACANPARRWMSSLRFLVITEGSKVTACLIQRQSVLSSSYHAQPGSGARSWAVSRLSVLSPQSVRPSVCLSVPAVFAFLRYLLRHLLLMITSWRPASPLSMQLGGSPWRNTGETAAARREA